MSGYTPLFDSLATGSLTGKWPDIGLWPVLLSLTSREGTIKATFAYISAVTGLPVEDVRACMERFCQPDPDSGSPAHEGRRLLPTGPHTWFVVNHADYRERARLMAKNAAEVASGKNRKRIRDRRRPPVTAADPLSDSDSDRNKDKDNRARFARPKRAASRRCPPDWQPSEKVLWLGASLGLTDAEIATELEKMRDWEFKDQRSDWDAAARNWLRNAVERKGQAGRPGYAPMSKNAIVSAEADRNLAEYRRLKGETG